MIPDGHIIDVSADDFRDWISYGTKGKKCPRPLHSGAEIDKLLFDGFMRKKYAIEERPYVSVFPVCPPANYPAPLPGSFVPFAELPKPRGADGLFPDERRATAAE
ncbi:MAG: hypothetical protein ACXV74_01830 [Methylobacter sp.]